MHKMTHFLFSIGTEPHHTAVIAMEAPDLCIKSATVIEGCEQTVAEGGIARWMPRLARKLKPDLSKAVWYGLGFCVSCVRHRVLHGLSQHDDPLAGSCVDLHQDRDCPPQRPT
jgi:hypothetical protein